MASCSFEVKSNFAVTRRVSNRGQHDVMHRNGNPLVRRHLQRRRLITEVLVVDSDHQSEPEHIEILPRIFSDRAGRRSKIKIIG